MANPHKIGAVVQARGLTIDPTSPEGITGANRLSDRFELKWSAGQQGKPALNAVIATDENSNAAAHLARNVADREFEVLGTNAVTASVSHYAEGGIALATAGADADSVIILPHLDTSQTAWSAVTWGTDKSTHWSCHIKTAANITNAVFWCGLKLTNTPTIATDNDQVFFRYEDDVSSGKIVAVSSIGGTDTSTVTDITVAVSTEYRFRVQIGADRCARMWVKAGTGAWVKVYTTAALTDATDLIPYIGVKADGAAAVKTLYVFGQTISRVIG